MTEFLKGKFVVTKSERLHSSIAVDQAHEQHNAIIKSTSGGMELLNRDDDGKALLRTTVSLPELVRMKEEYECLTSTKTPESSKEHHEAYSAFQKCFYKDVQNLFDSFNPSFNPFIVQNSPLLSYVNSADIMDNCIELDRSLRSMEFKGQQLYEEFVKQRIVECTVQITNPINKNNILLPSNVEKQGPADFVTLTAKEDRKLLMGLKTIAPIRKDATILALEYEPGNVPPVFTMRGKLYQSPKSNLLGRMPKLDEDQNTQTTENVVADNESTISSEIYKQLIVDLSMVTVKLSHQPVTKTLKSMKSFFDKVWDYIIGLGQYCSTVYIVTDNYTDDHPLKYQTRSARGSGTNVDFRLTSPLPSNFSSDFLLSSDNKRAMYSLMTEYFTEKCSRPYYTATFVITEGRRTVKGNMPSSTHLEADYRIV